MNQEFQQDLIARNGPLAGVELTEVRPVGGGCIHNSWRLELSDGRVLFAKTGGADAMALFEVEEEALIALHEYSDTEFLIVPRPLGKAMMSTGSILLLPWLDLSDCDQRCLGRGLALLHRHSSISSRGYFGWHRDGFIGSGIQPGGWRDSWGSCFVELRLKPQLALAGGFGIEYLTQKNLLKGINDLLNQHEVLPSLVHGDLWGGNAGCIADGRGVIFDPASWWADREVDLAMTRMFGGFSNDFYEEYEKYFPLEKGHKDRIEIYNLYHLLNHSNIFGGSYTHDCEVVLKRLCEALL